RDSLPARTPEAESENEGLREKPGNGSLFGSSRSHDYLLTVFYQRASRCAKPPPDRSCGLASLTVNRRPSNSRAVNDWQASLPSASFGISTNANPRERPVIRSRIRLTEPTVPFVAKRSRSSASPVLNDRLPTKILIHVL